MSAERKTRKKIGAFIAFLFSSSSDAALRCPSTLIWKGLQFLFRVIHLLEVALVFVLFILLLYFLKLFVPCKYLCMLANIVLLCLCVCHHLNIGSICYCTDGAILLLSCYSCSSVVQHCWNTCISFPCRNPHHTLLDASIAKYKISIPMIAIIHYYRTCIWFA